MVWPILSIQGFYISSRQTVIYFLFEKLFKKVWSRSNMFWIILSFQRLYNVFIKGLHIFFLFQIFLRNLNQGKYGVTHFVLFLKKMINNYQNHTWCNLSRILQDFEQILVKRQFTLSHIVLSRVLHKFPSKAHIFFLFEIFFTKFEL